MPFTATRRPQTDGLLLPLANSRRHSLAATAAALVWQSAAEAAFHPPLVLQREVISVIELLLFQCFASSVESAALSPAVDAGCLHAADVHLVLRTMSD